MNEPIELLSGEELSSSEIINDLLRQMEDALSKNPPFKFHSGKRRRSKSAGGRVQIL
jgi:hypothetical protein